MTKEGAWDRIAAEIDDDTVRLFAAVGRHDELAAAVEQRFGGAADAVYSSLSMDMRPVLPPDLIQDIRRLPAASRAMRRAGDIGESGRRDGEPVAVAIGPLTIGSRSAEGLLPARSLESVSFEAAETALQVHGRTGRQEGRRTARNGEP